MKTPGCPCNGCTAETGRAPGCHNEGCPRGWADWNQRHQKRKEARDEARSHKLTSRTLRRLYQ